MKLGTQTASLVNHIMTATANGELPEVGMGATISFWTDRHGGTVVEVMKNGVVAVQEDDAERIDDNGMSEMQEYRFTRNVENNIYYFRFNKKKSRWEQVYKNEETNRWKKTNGVGITFGRRNEYYDFTF